MGVAKFYRQCRLFMVLPNERCTCPGPELSLVGGFAGYISERFPCINQVIEPGALLPVFDNMYLDMNGIIHTCTHPNDEDVSEALTMKEMVLGMLSYVDR